MEFSYYKNNWQVFCKKCYLCGEKKDELCDVRVKKNSVQHTMICSDCATLIVETINGGKYDR